MAILMSSLESSFILNVFLDRAGTMIIIVLAVISIILSILNLFIYSRKVNLVISGEVVALSIFCVILSILIGKVGITVFSFILIIFQIIFACVTILKGDNFEIEENEEEEG